MSQPRLQYAMAVDGLLPPFFKRLDAKGNLRNGTIVSGTIMIFIATFVPFKYLNDMISCAVLSVLSITDTSIILMWHEAPDPNSNLTEWLALAYNMACLITAIAATNFLGSLVGNLTFILSTASMALSAFGLYKLCPRARVFGGRRDRHARGAMRTDDGYFRTPFLPFLPCAAIFVNWYLIAQLEITGVVGLAAFLGLAAIYYFVYAIHHSAGSKAGWGQVDTTDEDNYVQFDAGAFSSGEGGRSGVAERINCKTIS
jgi:amino acid transporter